MARHNSDRLLILVSCLALWALPAFEAHSQGTGRNSAVDSSVRTGAFSEAAVLLEKQAKAGSADAQYELGALYRMGRGVEQNDEAAFHWMKEAAAGAMSARNTALQPCI